jgi:hypothetical protein
VMRRLEGEHSQGESDPGNVDRKSGGGVRLFPHKIVRWHPVISPWRTPKDVCRGKMQGRRIWS